jgi:hypothetical protein
MGVQKNGWWPVLLGRRRRHGGRPWGALRPAGPPPPLRVAFGNRIAGEIFDYDLLIPAEGEILGEPRCETNSLSLRGGQSLRGEGIALRTLRVGRCCGLA